MKERMNEIKIRQANLSDVKSLQNLNNELCKYEKKNGFDTEIIDDWSLGKISKEYFEKLVSNDFVIVVEENDKIIGYLAGSVSYDETYSYYTGLTAELENIFVYEEYRRKGIGKMLIDSFYSWCKEKNAKRILVTASFGNLNSINFYKNQGFKEMNLILKHEI